MTTIDNEELKKLSSLYEEKTKSKEELTIDQLSKESNRDYIRKNDRVKYLDE
jgi:hypothetical protein